MLGIIVIILLALIIKLARAAEKKKGSLSSDGKLKAAATSNHNCYITIHCLQVKQLSMKEVVKQSMMNHTFNNIMTIVLQILC